MSGDGPAFSSSPAQSPSPAPGLCAGHAPGYPVGEIHERCLAGFLALCQCRCRTPLCRRCHPAGDSRPTRRRGGCSEWRWTPGCALSNPPAPGLSAQPSVYRGNGKPIFWHQPAGPNRFQWRTTDFATQSLGSPGAPHRLQCGRSPASCPACRAWPGWLSAGCQQCRVDGGISAFGPALPETNPGHARVDAGRGWQRPEIWICLRWLEMLLAVRLPLGHTSLCWQNAVLCFLSMPWNCFLFAKKER